MERRMGTGNGMAARVRQTWPESRLRLFTSACLTLVVALLLALPGRAHEVQPAIADLSTGDGQVMLDIRLNAEAMLAGINLDGITDTNETSPEVP